jgi:hypothetical protein
MLLYHATPDLTPRDLAAAGYDWLAGKGLVRCQTSAGPAGRGGTVLADSAQIPADRCRYEPSSQRWEPCGVEGLHVGLWTNQREPMPIDLARPDQFPGHPVRLVDGRDWLAPVARGWTEEDGELRWYVALPQRLERRDGTWRRGGVVQRYARLWQIAERWEERWAAAYAAAVARDTGDDAEQAEAGEHLLSVELPLSDAADLAAEVLSFNYRVTAAEISLLGLFDDAAPAGVLDALIDRPTRIAWAKKNARPAPDSSSTSAGDEDSTRGIDLP